jgi:gamma-glutamyltranspeptidase / glutathione hydrolase
MIVNENWSIKKPSISSKGGVVTSHHYEASQIGIDILKSGGNAVDAAVAMGLSLGVLEPWMSGIGGCGYMLYHDAKKEETHAIDFGVKSAKELDLSKFILSDQGQDNDLFGWPNVKDDINIHGNLSMAVPGYIHGVSNALNKFGTMSWKDVIEPACSLSKRGLKADWYATMRINMEADLLKKYKSSKNIFFHNDLPIVSKDPTNLDCIENIGLYNSYCILRDEGPETFYTGELSQILEKDFEKINAFITSDDLSDYKSKIYKTEKTLYRNSEVHVAPGLNAGPSLINALNYLEKNWTAQSSNPDAHAYESYYKALEYSYEKRLKEMGEPKENSCTTHLSVVDKDGNMVSLTQTLLSVFGSRVVLPESGILMNNGIMWFDPRPGKPNSLEAAKKPLCNMCPTIVLYKSGTKLALGASGGRRIFPAIFQTISFLLDYKMNLNNAFITPRIDYSGESRILVNKNLTEDIINNLDNYNDTTIVPDSVFSHLFAAPNAVMQESSGIKYGNAYIPSPWSSALSTD